MQKKNLIDDQKLENASGGNDGNSYNDWVSGTVHDVIYYDASSCLTLRNAPDGRVMYTSGGKPMGWQNGEQALVLPSSRTGDWIRANWNGNSGWVDARHVWY